MPNTRHARSIAINPAGGRRASRRNSGIQRLVRVPGQSVVVAGLLLQASGIQDRYSPTPILEHPTCLETLGCLRDRCAPDPKQGRKSFVSYCESVVADAVVSHQQPAGNALTD